MSAEVFRLVQSVNAKHNDKPTEDIVLSPDQWKIIRNQLIDCGFRLSRIDNMLIEIQELVNEHKEMLDKG